jgi:hypothetical protein
MVKVVDIFIDQLPIDRGVSIGNNQADRARMREIPIPNPMTKRSFGIIQIIIARINGMNIQISGALIWYPQDFLS